MYTFREFPAQYCVYPLTGYVPCENQPFCWFATMLKENLKSKIFCPKNSELYCVLVTKHILVVLYMHFISYFYTSPWVSVASRQELNHKGRFADFVRSCLALFVAMIHLVSLRPFVTELSGTFLKIVVK